MNNSFISSIFVHALSCSFNCSQESTCGKSFISSNRAQRPGARTLQPCTAFGCAGLPVAWRPGARSLQLCIAFALAQPPTAHSPQPLAARSAERALAARSVSAMSEMNVRWITRSKRDAMRAPEHGRTGSAWGRIACLQLVEQWLHALEGAELGESDILQALAHHGDVRAEVLGLVRVAANREDAPAQVAVQAQ